MMTEGRADTSSNKDNNNKNRSTVSSSSAYNNKLENVLVLQGGGSLGAFGCGVFKALTNNNIKPDIVAGISIGGINAAIIAGSKDEKHPEQMLEQFWLELSQSFVDLDKVTLPSPSTSLPKFVEEMLASSGYYYFYNLPTYSSSDQQRNYFSKTKSANEHAIKMRQLKSFYSSAIFGNDKMFKPRWREENILRDPEYFAPQKWTYMYDLSPLVKTLEKYIDYD